MRANNPRQFSSWFPLDRSSIAANAPDTPAALQVRAGGHLLDYPDGQSSMVCYLVATESANVALLEVFEDELDDPGSTGYPDLEFRYFAGDGAREWLVKLMYEFESKFGSLPHLNQRRRDDSPDTAPQE